jgi:hypothetical protein
MIYNNFIVCSTILLPMSEDNKPTKPVKEKVNDELTSKDDNKDSFDRGDAAAQEQQRILKQAKE